MRTIERMAKAAWANDTPESDDHDFIRAALRYLAENPSEEGIKAAILSEGVDTNVPVRCIIAGVSAYLMAIVEEKCSNS